MCCNEKGFEPGESCFRFIAGQTVTVYLLSVDEVKEMPNCYGYTHFPERVQRAGRFLKEADRLRCIGAGALLRGILGVRENQLCKNEYGKPFLREKQLCFNLSHGGRYIALAVDRQEIGTDIEPAVQAHGDLAEAVFQPEELEWMSEEPLRRFYTLWTLKESVIKQLGVGLSLAPLSFSVMPLIKNGAMDIDRQRVYAKTMEWDSHLLSVCSAHPFDEIHIIAITAKELLKKG